MTEQKAETATRITLQDSWKEHQQQVDWMHIPVMQDYVNRLVSGRRLVDNGHWATYAQEEHLVPLLERLRSAGHRGPEEGLSMISLGCGGGHVDAHIIQGCGWPVETYLGLDLDDELTKAAAEKFREMPHVKSSFDRFNLNELDRNFGQFDVIFCSHALHHCDDLEGLMEFLQRTLAPGGVIIGIEFFGPTRFQIEPEVRELLEELFEILPERLRRLPSYPVGPSTETEFRVPTLESVRTADISESVRSSDLRTLLFSTFPIRDRKPMGATLLRWLLQDRAGNFDSQSPEDVAILKLLTFIERKLIENREIRSDDFFFVLDRSTRL